MNSFPQLNTGAVVQYPMEATRHFRTVVNETEDGRQIRWSDADAGEMVWECQFSDLDSAEWSAILSLFDLSEGRLKTFAFFNPFENLLAWSEDFSDTIWTKGPLLTVSSGVGDPFGGTAGMHLVNGSAADQRLLQLVSVPSAYQTCFSIWAKGSGQIKLVRKSGGLVELRTFALSPTWTRINFSGIAGLSTDATEFGVQLAAGGQCDIFGAQLDLQLAPSTYRKSASRSGVYLNARFVEDRLEATAMGPGRTGAKVQVRARVGA